MNRIDFEFCRWCSFFGHVVVADFFQWKALVFSRAKSNVCCPFIFDRINFQKPKLFRRDIENFWTFTLNVNLNMKCVFLNNTLPSQRRERKILVYYYLEIILNRKMCPGMVICLRIQWGAKIYEFTSTLLLFLHVCVEQPGNAEMSWPIFYMKMHNKSIRSDIAPLFQLALVFQSFGMEKLFEFVFLSWWVLFPHQILDWPPKRGREDPLVFDELLFLDQNVNTQCVDKNSIDKHSRLCFLISNEKSSQFSIAIDCFVS